MFSGAGGTEGGETREIQNDEGLPAKMKQIDGKRDVLAPAVWSYVLAPAVWSSGIPPRHTLSHKKCFVERKRFPLGHRGEKVYFSRASHCMCVGFHVPPQGNKWMTFICTALYWYLNLSSLIKLYFDHSKQLAISPHHTTPSHHHTITCIIV